mmetsp:Transcript_76480/g.155244  ORF Transcript_76480/g.155244 Transcript_76480/m.155244 type:complete len:278 (+) Transcript_76480:51-884(+)
MAPSGGDARAACGSGEEGAEGAPTGPLQDDEDRQGVLGALPALALTKASKRSSSRCLPHPVLLPKASTSASVPAWRPLGEAEVALRPGRGSARPGREAEARAMPQLPAASEDGDSSNIKVESVDVVVPASVDNAPDSPVQEGTSKSSSNHESCDLLRCRAEDPDNARLGRRLGRTPSAGAVGALLLLPGCISGGAEPPRSPAAVPIAELPSDIAASGLLRGGRRPPGVPSPMVEAMFGGPVGAPATAISSGRGVARWELQRLGREVALRLLALKALR